MSLHMLSIPSLFAQAQVAANTAATTVATPVHEQGWFVALIAAAVLILPFVAGHYIARRIRMSEYSMGIGVMLFAVVASTVVLLTGWPPRLGIDLSGGVILVYETEQDPTRAVASADLAKLVRTKIDALKIPNVEVTNGPSTSQVTVSVPKDYANVAALGQQIVGMNFGTSRVELGTTKTEGDRQVMVFNTLASTEGKVDRNKLVSAVNRRINPGGVSEIVVRNFGEDQIEVIIPKAEKSAVDIVKRKISTSGQMEFHIVANNRDHASIIARAQRTPDTKVYDGDRLLARWYKLDPKKINDPELITRQDAKGNPEVLMVIGPYDVKGDQLSFASSGFDQYGKPAVLFTFKQEGAHQFGELTGHNLPSEDKMFKRKLAIVLDDELISAPGLEERINGSGQIHGSFTQQEVDFLVGLLNAGGLPARLQKEPVSENSISPLLGDDTIKKGAYSLLVATIAVLIFMLVYYGRLGMVANLAVVVNIMLVVSVMMLINAAFSLAGLAGLVLSVGMAVDANVLIYERMREEAARGAATRMAIRNGFNRAMATILDSHVTTILTGVVLYVIGTDQLKGFAVTLVLGLLLNLFTAVYCARILFDIMERQGWLKELKMMHIFGHTNYDFVRWTGLALGLSAVFIITGLVAAWHRGSGLLDIDFTGGTSVQVVFKPDPTLNAEVIKKKVEGVLEDVVVAGVSVADDKNNNLQYKIDSREADIPTVEKKLMDLFPGKLQTTEMSFGGIARIEPNRPLPGGAVPSTGPQSGPELKGPAIGPATAPAKAVTPATPAKTPEAPAPAKAPAAPAPAKTGGKQSSVARPNEMLLALADPTELQLAQADKAAKTPATTAAPAAKATTAPAATTPPKATTAPAATKPTAPAMPALGAPVPSVPDATAISNPFAGGSEVELKFPEKIDFDGLHIALDSAIANMNLRNVTYELYHPQHAAGSSIPRDTWTLTINQPGDKTLALLNSIKTKLESTPLFLSANRIGGKVAGETQRSAIYAILASMLMIAGYIWIRFQNLAFGLAAIVALVHDVLITVGALALSYYVAPFTHFLLIDPFKISLDVVAAILTIVGYSMNDTIVVFDRIREVRGKSPDITKDIINRSVNQTLSRTVLTVVTVLMVTIILYIGGGQGLHAFAFTMLIGLIAGTFSSIYIAAPVLLWFKKPTAMGAANKYPTGRAREASGTV